jgi:mannose-1-phosphate guanylyltransferase
MLQNTVERLSGLDIRSVKTICNENHRFFVAEQMREIDVSGTIILEPCGRNTAPAIALAAIEEKDDPLLLVLAADHIIHDDVGFRETISSAIPLAESGQLITFGVVASEPNTGYGYIKSGAPCGVGYKVDSFVEKPTKELAQEYLQSKNYYWNSGMFLFKASSYLGELRKFNPEIFDICNKSIKHATTDLDFLRVDKEIFSKCPSDSVDYAVMEKTADAVVVPFKSDWSDIGSWATLKDISTKDSYGNSSHGDTILHRTKNSYIRANDKLFVAIGLENIIAVSTKDAVLVAHEDCVQDVKVIAEKLKSQCRSEWEVDREVYRPWGKYDSIDIGNRYQVKRITVNPGAKLSVQMHHHRAEHWIVVSGTARVTKGDQTFLLSENESTYIPVGTIHALENPGKVSLELIEVQSGSYLGEDDIVRFEDKYGRLD